MFEIACGLTILIIVVVFCVTKMWTEYNRLPEVVESNVLYKLEKPVWHNMEHNQNDIY